MMAYTHKGDKPVQGLQRDTSGDEGGGTNPVVRMGARSMGTSFAGRQAHGPQKAAAARQVLQIAVWRADAVTFVCWWCATLETTGLERHVLSLWLHHTQLE